MTSQDTVRAVVRVRGYVQGVGFRMWAARQARALGVVGYARNLADGSVEVVAQGRPADVWRLLELVREQPPSSGRPGRVTDVGEPDWVAPEPDEFFSAG